MTYLLTERIPLDRALYINEMTFTEFKQYSKRCSNDEERKIQFNKMRRLANEIILGNGSMNREYKHSINMEHFGRLCSKGMQGLMKELRGFFMRGFTTDIDMKNAHPVLLLYICKKHNIDHPNLEYYINNRDDVLDSFSKLNREEAKTKFLKAINKDTHDKNEKNTFFRKFDNELKNIQKSLSQITEYNYIFDTVPADREYNTLGSKLNRVLCTFEDKVLQEAVKAIQEEEIEVCTLMFDGCLVYGNHYDSRDLLDKITKKCEELYEGLNMCWDYKHHSDLLQMPDGWVSKKLAKMMSKVEILAPEDVDSKRLEEKIEGIMDGDDAGAGKAILKHYPHWKCCNSILYVFDDMTGMWSDKIDVQNRIISGLSRHLNIIKNTKDGLELTGKNYANCNHKRKEIFPYIRQNCVDDDWMMRTQNSSLGKILFKNGHYDFIRSVFVEGSTIKEDETENGYNPDIVFYNRIDHDFTDFSPEDKVYMETIRNRLFTIPLGENVGDYLILNLARGLAGDVMKRILFGLGMSNTGKGIQTKACQLSMGQYCGNFTAENLAYNNNSNDEAQKLRWVYLLRNKRVIISNEITNNKPLNGNLIKKISSGGDSLQARVHGGLETDFIPQFLTIVLANDIPEIKPYDDAVQNRVRVYSYTKSFVDEPANEFELRKDPNLEKEMETKQFQRCFIGLLVQSYLTFQQNGRVENEPQEVMVAKTNWMGSNEDNNIMNKFQQQFEITNSPEDYVFSKDIETWITSTKEMSYMKFVMELKKYCIIEKYDDVINKFKKVNKVNYKSWFGIKKISQQQEEEREEEESIEGCIFEEI
jgi:hypothetical protein